MSKIKIIIVLLVMGLGLWFVLKRKPLTALPTQPTGETKTPAIEASSLPLEAWRILTQQQLQGLPVTQQKGQVGVEPYYKTSEPIAIGDTGFKIWGMTERGSVVVSKRDPATYDPTEWWT